MKLLNENSMKSWMYVKLLKLNFGSVLEYLTVEAAMEVPEYLTVEAAVEVPEYSVEVLGCVLAEAVVEEVGEAVALVEARAGITWGNWDRKSRRSQK